MRLRRPRLRNALSWAAAAFAAVAALFLAGVFAIARDDGNATTIVVAAAAVIGVYVAASRRPRGRLVASLAVGLTLNVGAVFLGIVLLIVGGSCSGDGHTPLAAWILGGAVYLAGAVWSLRRPQRTWWALPAATLLGAVVLVGLSVLVTGSTGVCLD